MAKRAILIRFETIGFFGRMLLKTPVWSAPTLGTGMQIPVHTPIIFTQTTDGNP